MARVYEPVGPSSNKAVAPVSEVKKLPEKSQKTQKETGGQ